MRNIIIEAISSKKCLGFSYDGFPRVVEPHAYGKSTAGNDEIRAYQTRGGSSSGKLGFKLFTLDRIIGLNLINEEVFSPRQPPYKRDDQGMSEIYCQI